MGCWLCPRSLLQNGDGSIHQFERAVDFYLVRHGEAISATLDPQRPLSRLGRQDVERLARCAIARNVRPAAIFHSGILRAQQTAEILAQYVSPPAGVQSISGLLPEDDPMVAKGELEASERSLALVGHLPHMNRLLALLIHGEVQKESADFRPATMVCCSFDGDTWKISWTISHKPS